MPRAEQGLGLDLELNARQRLTAIGAIHAGTDFHRAPGTPPTAALRELDTFAAQSQFVFGHNILWHDLPWLIQHAPDLALLQKPAVDTLVLSAIAFAEHPYHHLLKDYKIVRDAMNDPVADARIAAILLTDAQQRLAELTAANPTFGRVIHALGIRGLHAISEQASRGFALVFEPITPPSPATDLDRDLHTLLADRACKTALRALSPLHTQPAQLHLELLFATAWLRVAGTPDSTSRSVVMPWVRRQLPRLTQLLRDLRDRPCRAPDCVWCHDIHDPVAQLQRWFQYPDFRAEPHLTNTDTPAQRAIVDAGFADTPLLALLPTGGGKSLCFQLPAIARYIRRGCLTIVISPLQSLMHDQVDNFTAKTGANFACALTGRLTPPERRATLDAVRNGEAGILYVAPEQLRNSTFKKAIALREIGAWVFDEAHCLSKWGHDFRPDYLYAARFIQEFSAAHEVTTAPIVCVTATAKPEVRDEILQHFRTELGQDLQVFDGQAERENLSLRVESVAGNTKATRLLELVAEQLTTSPTGSILVYTATRDHAEKTAALLTSAGIDAEAFHAGLDIPRKKAVQQRFLSGEARVVCATNAFGMGIDKPDIRLVVHFEIPGSIEAYVQEVGRAGRDNKPAVAVLLFAEDDIETQFRLAARSRLDLRDLRSILRRIRNLARPTGPDQVRETICTTGEILQDDELAENIDPGDRGAPTRVVTAIAWLERGKFLRRDENATTVFQGSPKVKTIAEAKERIATLDLHPKRAEAWLAILTRLMNAEADDGFSSDDFLGLPEVLGVVGTVSAATAGRSILRILVEMQKAKLLSTGVQMTAFVRAGVTTPSTARLHDAIILEAGMLDLLREQQPDPEAQEHYPLNLLSLTQALLRNHPTATRDRVHLVLSSMADRAQHAGQRAPGLRLRFTSRDHCMVQVKGSWEQVLATSRRRHTLAQVCLTTLLEQLPEAQARGASLLVEFSLEQLVAAMDRDLELRSQPSPDRAIEIEYALLFLHKIGAIVLHKGLAVFRQAMVLQIPGEPSPRRYTLEDFRPLAEHQTERTVHIHAMHEFARRMVADRDDGLQLLHDYFELPRERFLARYFAHRSRELDRATSPESWQRIVLALSKDQRRIVEAGEDDSLLVLAGPGSGKTRVVVHRCAYLLRVQRVPARAILVLCFNRSAALELRRRLRDLVGDDARGVLVQTYHGMAARLAGRSPADLLDAGQSQEAVFGELMQAAIAQLTVGNQSAGEADGDDLRDRLLTGFRHILVDEYQDIDEQQYELVSAIAGRTLQDADRRLTVLAVGDDDQNVYQWRGSNVQFLRRFETDYEAERIPLVENYRSTAHIIAAANQLIAQNGDRLKQDAPIRIDSRRRGQERGGRFAGLDQAVRGRVHILEIAHIDEAAFAVRAELRRLAACDPEFTWSQCAVLSPRHALLDPVRALLEADGIPVRYRVDSQQAYSLFRLREVQGFLDAVAAHPGADVDAATIHDLLCKLRAARPTEPGINLVEHALAAFLDECGGHRQPKASVREFFGELLMERRRERTLGEGVMLGTVHGSKGAEHEHVILLDGGWQPRGGGDLEEIRRVYYVGMTRARQTLALVQCERGGAPWLPGLAGESIHRTQAASSGDIAAPRLRYELLGQADVYLAFAGRDPRHEEIADAISRLSTGDPLTLVPEGRRLYLHDVHGVRIGALSEAASQRWQGRRPEEQRAHVAAILLRRRADEGTEYQPALRRDTWYVVVPEVVSTERDASA